MLERDTGMEKAFNPLESVAFDGLERGVQAFRNLAWR
jgi:hypothetical protein